MSAFSTVLNFSVLGLLRRLHRINIQQTLQASLQNAVKFPSLEKHHNKKGKNKIYESFLSEIKDDEIAKAVQKTKAKARNTVQELSMDKRSTLYGTKKTPQKICLLKYRMMMMMMMMKM